MPQQAGKSDSDAASFVRDAIERLPTCELLALDSYQSLSERARTRPKSFGDSSVLPMVAKLRAASQCAEQEASMPLAKAIQDCAAASALRYRFAHRPARSDLISCLAEGLLSIARSGAVDRSVIVKALSPVFQVEVEELSVELVLSVLVSSINELPYFANPLLGYALCQAIESVADDLSALPEHVAQEVALPALAPLAAVAASTCFSPGTSVVSHRVASLLPSLLSAGAMDSVKIETKYAPQLTTSVTFPGPHPTRVRLDCDAFNAFAAVFLLPSLDGVQALNQFHLVHRSNGAGHLLSVAGVEKRLTGQVLHALQQLMFSHLSHPTHAAWANYRAITMGDF